MSSTAFGDIDLEQENKEILNAYRGLLRACKRIRDQEDTRLIRKAFNVAVDAHKDMRRKSGEPYIYHPIAVARIAAEEIGLGTTSIICALLHDTVEDTEITLEDIESMFGPKVSKIIDGLTKISGVFDHTDSIQAENFRKMLLTLSDDVRVILLKLADRLHNMRTLNSMRRDKQLKIASETLFLYAPLAHRLGLNGIKTELEDLSYKYKDPEFYEEISHKLNKTKAVRQRFINRFSLPIKRELESLGYKAEIKGRPKSVFSVSKKIKSKNIPFEEVYDLFAIRIILDSDPETEKADCWKVYSVVTDFYKPNPDRLRDWISTPRANGYESLHTTVMSPTGKWMEVQIRTRRMDEIAEKGYAAHWKYKGNTNKSNGLDMWISQIRELLEHAHDNANALDFVDDFKLNLFADEIFVFTPKGDMKVLPINSTILDFAFHIHTQVGAKCIGAKVNQRLVPLSYNLKSGDQIEIITANKQKPKEDWLNMVVTGSAKSKIKLLLREERRKFADTGKETLQRKMKQLRLDWNNYNLNKLVEHYKVKNAFDLYYYISMDKIKLHDLKEMVDKGGRIRDNKKKSPVEKKSIHQIVKEVKEENNTLIIGDNTAQMDYTLAKCCHPIPGDDVFGFITVNDGIRVHRVNCPNAIQLMSNYAYRIIKTRWASEELVEFPAGIRFQGIDDLGLVNEITQIISADLNINMKSIHFESSDGMFNGEMMVFVQDTGHLDALIEKLGNIQKVINIERIEVNS